MHIIQAIIASLRILIPSSDESSIMELYFSLRAPFSHIADLSENFFLGEIRRSKFHTRFM